MIQLIPFDTSKAGKVPNYCLDNTRRGYGIQNKYGSAWIAWLHTEQHHDRNIPEGLDIPLYYSYTTTIDGVTENYGHINVRLKDGRVWSDGNIYPSLDAYLSTHAPRYVGWGESINDYKIIGDDMLTEDNFYRLFRGMLGRDPSQQEAEGFTRDPNTAVEALWNNGSKQRYEESKQPQEYVPYTLPNLYVKKG